MNTLQRAAFLAAAAACMYASADPVWSYFPEGDAWYNVLSNNAAREQGTVEGRIGNRLNIGTWELGIWRVHDIGPFLALGQLEWFNGVAAPFSIVYDGSRGVSFSLGTSTITTTELGGTFTDIFIRTRSATFGDVDLSSMRLFTASGELPIGDLASMGAGDVEYIRIENMGQRFGAFELRGQMKLTWLASDPPINSQVNAQFRFTNVPSPASLAALAPLALRPRRRAFRV